MILMERKRLCNDEIVWWSLNNCIVKILTPWLCLSTTPFRCTCIHVHVHVVHCPSIMVAIEPLCEYD